MAPPRQLVCRDLKSGDIMLQDSLGNAPGKLIAFGQAMTGHKHANIVHAGIMYDSTYIIEALGAGIQSNDIRVGTRNCRYTVFRPKSAQLGTIAGNLAKLLFDSHGVTHNLKYDVLGAAGSLGASKGAKSSTELDAMVDKIFGAKTNRFFCSQFVVVTYQIAGGQIGMKPSAVLTLDDAKVAPARLATILEASATFDEVGFLAPGKR